LGLGSLAERLGRLSPKALWGRVAGADRESMERWERIRSRPWLWGPVAAVLVIALIAAATLVLNRDDGGTAGASPTTPTATTPAPPGAVPTTPPTTTVPTTAVPTTPPTTTTPVPTPTRPSPTPPKPRIAVPGVVAAKALEGAGSGEVEILWNAVPRATGYRIYRTNPSGGQLRLVVDFNIITGRVTAAPEVLALSTSAAAPCATTGSAPTTRTARVRSQPSSTPDHHTRAGLPATAVSRR
jgi:hypothetical protein